MRADGATKSIHNGISTQPISQQAPGFAETQLNFVTDSQTGLSRRESLHWHDIIKLENSPEDVTISDEDTVHLLTIQGDDWWLVLRPNKEFLMIDEFHQSHPTRFLGNALAYTNTDTEVASSNSIAVIASTEVIPEMDLDIIRQSPYVSMINVKQTVLSGDSIEVRFRKGSLDDDFPHMMDVTISGVSNDETVLELAQRMAEEINEAIDDEDEPAEVNAVAVNTTVVFNRTSIATFDKYVDVAVTGNTSITGVNGLITSTADLPLGGPLGEIVELDSSGSDGAGMYFRMEYEDPDNETPDLGNPVVIYTDDSTLEEQDTYGTSAIRWFDQGYIDEPYYDEDYLGVTLPLVKNGINLRSDEFLGTNITALVFTSTAELTPGTFGRLHFAGEPISRPVSGSMYGEFLEGNTTHYEVPVTFTREDSDPAFLDDVRYRINWPYDSITVNEIERIVIYPETDENALEPTLIESGVWRETSAPGEIYEPVKDSFPHVLSRRDTHWVISHADDLTGRNAGNEENNPLIMDDYINDVAFIQSRAIFAVGSNVVMSQTRNYLNFFRQTMANLLSNDPVSISTAATRDVPLDFFVPHTGGITAFNKVGQYKISGTEPIDPTTIALPHSGTYPYTETARPVSSGEVIYFPNDFGRYKGINAMGVAEGRDYLESVTPVTSHVERMLEGEVDFMLSDPLLRLIVVTMKDSPVWYVGDITSTHIAWSSHTLADNVSDVRLRAMNIDDGELKIVYSVDNVLGIGTYQLRRDDATAHLDYQLIIPDAVWEVALPEDYPLYDNLQAVQGEGCPEPGAHVISQRQDNLLLLQENMRGGTIHVGVPYTSVYTPSQIQVRDAGGHVQSTANLRINRWRVELDQSGSLDADIISDFYDFPTQTFDGIAYSSNNARYNNINLRDSYFDVSFALPANQAKIQFSTSHHSPANITGLEWFGVYNKRGRRF